MSLPERISEDWDVYDEEEGKLLFLGETPEDFEDCIVGVMESFGGPPKVCYDKAKVIRQLKKRGMTTEDAMEWFSFNIIGAYMGEQTPVYLTRYRKGKDG